MKHLIILLLMIIYISTAMAQSTCRNYKNGVQELENFMATKNYKGAPGFALTILRGDTVIFSKGYGVANQQSAELITPHSPFYIASIGKNITAVAILLLRQQKKIELADRIVKYFPELPGFMNDIRLYHLLTHTSGIPDYYAEWGEHANALTNDKIYTYIKSLKALNFEPGTDYSYSNSAYNLLAILIEKISGLSYSDFTHQHFFEPLGMKNTFVHSTVALNIPGKVIGYSTDSTGIRRTNDYEMENTATGSGGIYSTTEDLGKWITALTSGKILTTRNLNLLLDFPTTLNGNLSYIGMGWTNESFGPNGGALRNLKVFGSVGVLKGFRTNMVYVPELNLSYIILCNSGRFEISYEEILPFFFEN
jgi:CubicO group peptidase (beta-lactamase class C family)